MVKSKSLCGKITIISIMICMSLILVFCSIFLTNNVYAETVYAESTNPVYGFNAKTECDILANGGHKVGTIKLGVTSSIKKNGEGVIFVQAEVIPLLNDGANDYQVVEFSMNVGYSTVNYGMSNIMHKDNNTSSIILDNGGQNYVTGMYGTKFNVSNDYSVTKLRSNENASVSRLDEGNNVSKKSRVYANKPVKDNAITYQVSHTFKASKIDTALFYVEFYNLQVDGIFLAPDYGLNNNDNIFLWGTFDSSNNQYGLDCTLGEHSGKNDGSPNDSLSLKSFTWNTYVD